MNWELGSLIGGIATAIGIIIPFIVKYFKKRKTEKADEKIWRNDVSESLKDIKDIQQSHSERIEANEKAINDKEIDCKLKHVAVDNRIDRMVDYTRLLKEVVSSVKNIEDKQNMIDEKQGIMANDVVHVKELLLEKLSNVQDKYSDMSERMKRVEDKALS